MRHDILTVSGDYFDFLNPEQSNFNIFDIAHALSNICRFTGHTKEFYSVAQHSVLVSQIVPTEFALQGLLHDGTEAFIGDVSKPLKNLLPDYREIEKRVEKAILNRFGLPEHLDPSVKKADIILLLTEQRDLMQNNDKWEGSTNYSPMEEIITPVGPAHALWMFLNRFYELCPMEDGVPSYLDIYFKNLGWKKE